MVKRIKKVRVTKARKKAIKARKIYAVYPKRREKPRLRRKR